MKMVSGLHERVMARLRGLGPAAASCGASAEIRSANCRLRDRFCFALHRGDEGQSLVELALSLPILLLLLTGTFSISMALFTYEELGQAVFVASQTVQDGRGYALDSDPCAVIATSVTNALPNWPPANFTYTLQVYTSGTAYVQFGPQGQTSFTCPSGAGDLTQNQQAILTVNYKYTWIPAYLLNLGTGTLSQSRSVMVE
jgi:Flp pilus assembly protein TadG